MSRGSFATTGGDVVVCPLCHGSRASVVSIYPYEAIWRSLSADLDANFSDTVRRRHSPAAETRLCECETCGLQFFAPSAAGDADFYRELMSSIPYEPTRWEFHLVTAKLGDAASVIDIGCGEGAFLRNVRARAPGVRVVGVDHNADAIQHLRNDGIEAYAADVKDVARREAGSFDVVCAFQILEHLSDPRSLIEVAAPLLSPRGRLFVSVPNRDRVAPSGLQPLDCPPHHITRWQARQFEFLASELGLELHDVAFEQPSLDALRARHRRRAQTLFGSLGPRPALLAARINGRLRVPRPWHEWQTRRGAYRRRGVFGHTMVGQLRRSRARSEVSGATPVTATLQR